MRRLLALLLIAAVALAPAACRKQPEGALKVVVIGGTPKLRDPSLGPLSPGDAVLLQNVAQGLVRFDSSGDIVGGLAERWNVSDDGLSYIFRLAAAQWPDGTKITAQQIARLLKRQLASRSRNSLKDPLGAIGDVVAMTDRVIEIQLVAPRPNLLALLAQPELGLVREGAGVGPFHAAAGKAGEIDLTRQIAVDGDDEPTEREEVALSGTPARDAVRAFATAQVDLVLGGTFADLPIVQRIKLPRGSLRFDPAAGLFGLVPVRSGGPLDRPEVRRLLSQALDRGNYIAALGVPGLVPRATVLQPGVDGIAVPVAPAWMATPLADRVAGLRAQGEALFANDKPGPVVRVALPDGPGADLLLQELIRDWGAVGLTVEKAPNPASADLLLIDEVAPSASAAWFVRRFRCGAVRYCSEEADTLMEAARQTMTPAQRYALLAQAAARIDDAQLFIPIAAPVRWSLVSARIQGFAGNRYARHTLTGLQQSSAGGN